MAVSTERHKRERLGIIAEANHSNREYIRIINKAKALYSDWDVVEKALWDGELNIPQLNRVITGDTRKGLYVKVRPELHARLKNDAAMYGLTMSEYMEYLLPQIFGEVEP